MATQYSNFEGPRQIGEIYAATEPFSDKIAPGSGIFEQDILTLPNGLTFEGAGGIRLEDILGVGTLVVLTGTYGQRPVRAYSPVSLQARANREYSVTPYPTPLSFDAENFGQRVGSIALTDVDRLLEGTAVRATIDTSVIANRSGTAFRI